MKRLLTVLLLALPFSAQADTALEARLRKALDEKVPKLLADNKVPSVAIGLIRGGEFIFSAQFGEAAPGKPATAETLYNVASLTKPLAAEVYLRAATAKSIPLDEPLSVAWTDPDIQNDPRTATLTAPLLLSHRSGFPNWRRQTGGKLKFLRDPGTAFGYSGEGLEYLKAYLIRRTATPFDTLTKTFVFEPLGMKDSYLGWPSTQADRVATPSAGGKWLKTDTNPEVLAADNLHTTARDYALFLQAVVTGVGLPKAARDEQLRVHTDRKAELCAKMDAKLCPDEAGIGLGWEVYKFGATTILMHTGNDAGESAVAFADLSRRDATVVMANSKDGISIAAGLLDDLELDPKFVAFLKAM